MTEGSDWNAAVQKRWVSTAAPAALGPSSSGPSSRPSTGLRPITLKYDPPTTPALTCRGSPRPIIVNGMTEKSPNSDNDFTRPCKSRSSGTEKLAFGTGDARRALAQIDQAILVLVDERPQQHAAHHAEDGRVGADAQRQGGDDGEGEAFDPGQRAEGVADVGEQAH